MARRAFESLCFFVLVGVTALRPLVAESYDSAGSSVARAVEEIGDPSPARTLTFDLLILAAGCGWLGLFAADRMRRYRVTGLEIGAALVVVAGIVSCALAGNRRLAIVATVDWLCLPVLVIVLVQLLKERWRRDVLVAALLAGGCAQAAQCYEQYFLSFDETWSNYENRREEFWAKQGVALDSSTVESFERRIKAREATGFFSHANAAASYLMLCGFAGVGWVVERLRRGVSAGANRLVTFAGMLFVCAMFGAMVLTKSLGAMVATGGGAAIWFGRIVFGRWIEAHPRRALLIGWACAVAGGVAVIGHGLYHDALPGWSLTFRWQYWKASAELIADHAWTGVGRENFGRHYLQYKSIESPEEVANPHNLLVQAGADWGVVGLAGVVAMLVGGSLIGWRRPRAERDESERTGFTLGKGGTAWVVGLLLVVTLVRATMLGSSEPNFVYYSTTTVGLAWLIGMVAFCWGAARNANTDLESLRRDRANDGADYRDIVVDKVRNTAIGVGLLAFLLHEMINFALFVPASATAFFAFAAVWLSSRAFRTNLPLPEKPGRVLPRWIVWVAAAAVIVGVAFNIFMPVNRAGHYLAQARTAWDRPVRGDILAHPTVRFLDSAAAADSLDPTPHHERAKWLAGQSADKRNRESTIRESISSLEQAIERDPINLGLWQAKARMETELAGMTHQQYDFAFAADSARKALELYPQNPSGLKLLGDTLLAEGLGVESVNRLEEAVVRYGEAIEMDNRRLAWERIRRLGVREVQEINERIEIARRAIHRIVQE